MAIELALTTDLENFAEARPLTMSDTIDALPIGIYVVPSQAIRDHLGIPGLGTLTVYSGTHTGTAQLVTNNTPPSSGCAPNQGAPGTTGTASNKNQSGSWNLKTPVTSKGGLV